MAGQVHREQYLCLHTRIGSVEADGATLEVLSGLPLNTPMIRHPDGRTWTLGWQEIAGMAVAAFNADTLAKVAEEAPCPA